MKIEHFLRINKVQLVIKDYYFTTNNGLIAWVKLDPARVSEIHRRAAKAGLKEFRSVTYISLTKISLKKT